MLEKFILFVPVIFAWAICQANCKKTSAGKSVASFAAFFILINACSFFVVLLLGKNMNFGNLTKRFMAKFILLGFAEGIAFLLFFANHKFQSKSRAKIDAKSICSKISIITYCCYAAYVFFTFWNDFHFFDFSCEERKSYYTTNGNPHSVLFYVFLKIAFCLLIFAFFRFVSKLILKCLHGDEKTQKKVKIYALIFACYAVALIFVYPGIWKCNSCDELKLLSFTKRLQIQYHQGVVSSLMYFFALMCYPKPFMVVAFQMTIGVFLLGNIAADLLQISKKAFAAFLILIFSPCALYFALYPIRIYIFSVLFLTFVHNFVKLINNKNFSKTEFLKMTTAVCILINTRQEVMFLLLAYPAILIKYCGKKKAFLAFACLVFSVLATFGIKKFGNHAWAMSHNTLMLGAPLGMFFSDKSIDKSPYAKDIANIDKVWNVKTLTEKGSYNFIGGERTGINAYTKSEFKAYLKSAIKILAKNPGLYVKSKILCALEGLGMSPNRSGVGYAIPKNMGPKDIVFLFEDVDKDSHNLFARIFAGKFKIFRLNFYYVFYAFWLPTLLAASLFFGNLLKDKNVCLVIGVLLFQFFLTVFTAPVGFPMYYGVEYFVGWYMWILFKKTNYKELR